MEAAEITNRDLYNQTLSAYLEDNNAQRLEMLEAIVDAVNVKSLLSYISTVCEDKSQHISDNWQDTKLAKQWSKAARLLGTCANKLPNDEGIGYGKD